MISNEDTVTKADSGSPDMRGFLQQLQDVFRSMTSGETPVAMNEDHEDPWFSETARCFNEHVCGRMTELQESIAADKAAMEQIAEVCDRAARGDLEARILHIKDKGVTGKVQHSINHMLDLTDAFVREAKASLQHASEEQFYRKVLSRGFHGTYVHAAEVINEAASAMEAKTRSLEVARQSRLGLADSFEKTVEAVVSSVAASATEMELTAGSLNQKASGTGARMSALAENAAELEEGIAEVVLSTEELSSTSRNMGDKVSETRQVAESAAANAEMTAETIAQLSKSSKAIEEVVNLVGTIARQTNLLALNASIEAARAGDAGRGFSVVASEVKNLADRTREATNDISRIISSVIKETSDAVDSVEEVARTIAAVKDYSEEVAEAVSQQQGITSRILDTMRTSAEMTRSVKREVVEEAGSSADTRDASAEMLQGASDLNRMATKLEHEVAAFMTSIRSD